MDWLVGEVTGRDPEETRKKTLENQETIADFFNAAWYSSVGLEFPEGDYERPITRVQRDEESFFFGTGK